MRFSDRDLDTDTEIGTGNEELFNIIVHLMELKQEGSYWDFKKEWYKDNKKSDLLHDIICMSNNLVNRDAYLIIGVDDDYRVNDIKGDINRKNTQNLVDFLKDKNFVGGIRPTVIVETLKFGINEVDVIIIKNSNNTPFYLTTRYKDIEPFHIYSRIQDTNTPVNNSADIDKVELLWKKRFGLLYTPLEQVESFLTDIKGWSNGPYGETDKYYRMFPEFTIQYTYDDSLKGYEYYLFSQYDNRPHWYNIEVKYHQTVLIAMQGISLDGGRYFTPVPEISGVHFGESLSWDISYRYFILNSFKFKLNEFFYFHEFYSDSKISRRKFLEVILLFENNKERVEFEKYVMKNWKIKALKYDSFANKRIPYIKKLEGYKKGAFIEDYKNAIILKCMLSDFREELLNT